MRTFAASPSEGVLRPALASTFFPHLPQRSRTAFRIGLALIVVGLAVCGLVRITSFVVGIAAVGPALLFLVYLGVSRVTRDLPRGGLPAAAFVGAALGTGWARATARLTVADYGLAAAPPSGGLQVMGIGIATALGGAALMVLPAVAVRLIGTSTREALDGFVIGAFGALVFTACATVTRLAVQFQTGFIPHSRPRASVVIEAVMSGVAIPVTGAATGGVVGLLLWFTPNGSRSGRARPTLWSLACVAGVVYAMIGAVDTARLPQTVMLAVHLVLTVVALLIARLSLQVALMHEKPDPVIAEPVLCEHCEHVVPDAPFCAACGAASRASSKASRRSRRRVRPVPLLVGGDS